MNQFRKSLYIIIIVLVLLLAGGTALYRNINNESSQKNNSSTGITSAEDKIQSAAPAVKEKTPAGTPGLKFKTNDEIKVRYGKIEEVFLYNGKRYEGAVLTTDEFYTIVTVDGTFKIPMKEVKLRNIIR